MRIHAAPFRLVSTLSCVSDVRVSFRLATRARFALRLPGCSFVSETRAARCVRPTSASHNFYRLRAPVSRRFSTRVGAARAPRVPRSGSASRHSPRFGGSRFFLRRIVGRSLPRARRATVPLAPPSPHALCSLLSSRVTSRTIETASAWTPSEGLPSSAVRSAFHRQGSAPSFRTPSRAPDLDAILFTARDFGRSRTASRLRFARASPWLAPFGARSARRALGPVCPDLVRFRKRRSNASLDRRRRPTTSATRHDPRARPSSCRSSPVPYKRTAVLPVACATLARGGPRPHVNHRRMVPALACPTCAEPSRTRTGIPGEERAARPCAGRGPRPTLHDERTRREQRAKDWPFSANAPPLCRSRAPGSPMPRRQKGLEAPSVLRDAGQDRRPPPPRERRRFRNDRGAFHCSGIPSKRDAFRLSCSDRVGRNRRGSLLLRLRSGPPFFHAALHVAVNSMGIALEGRAFFTARTVPRPDEPSTGERLD